MSGIVSFTIYDLVGADNSSPHPSGRLLCPVGQWVPILCLAGESVSE
jgi:hypothetical protein